MVKITVSASGIKFDKGKPWDIIKPPPKGLTPIGDSGWSHNPGSVDPRNCTFYPDSPWCGKNPFTARFDPTLSVEPTIDTCGFTLRFGGTVAFIKTSNYVLSYRFPGECRKEPPKPPPADFSELPKPKDRSESSGFDKKGIGLDDKVFALITQNSVVYQSVSGACSGDPSQIVASGYKTTGGELRCPYPNETHTNSNGNSVKTEIVANFQGASIQTDYELVDCPGMRTKGRRFTEGKYLEPEKIQIKWNRLDPNGRIYEISTVNFRLRRVYYAISGGLESVTNSDLEAPPPYERITGYRSLEFQYDLVYGRYGFIKDYFEFPRIIEKSTDPDRGTQGVYLAFNCDGVINPNFCPNELPYFRNPPPPPPDPRECCMQCCSPSQFAPQSNQDLSEIIKRLDRIEKKIGTYPAKATIFDENEDAEGAQSKVINWESIAQGQSRIIERVEKISKIIGIDSLPIKLPKSPIEKVDNNVLGIIFDWFSGTEVKITSMLQLEVYLLKYLNGVFGHWMRKIHIQDADAVKEGDQPLDIVLPDIGTSLEQLVSVSTANHKALGLITDIVTKIMIEVCNTKLDTAEAKLIIRDIQQWLDYPTRELAVDVPIGINVPGLEVNISGTESEEERKALEAQRKELEALKKDISKFMQPGKAKVIYDDWDGTGSLTDRLLHLATIAGTARGQGV